MGTVEFREEVRTSKGRKEIGQKKGAHLVTKKSVEAKETMKKHCKDFGGTLKNVEVIKLCGITRNSFYKYKREISEKLTM